MTVPSDFNSCLDWLWPQEGGYSVDPVPTNMGIEQEELTEWCYLHNSPEISVKEITKPTATAIYLASYWNPFCPELPPGVNLMFFDTGVNQGVHIAVVFLQRAMGIPGDGHWGVVTQANVKRIDKSGPNGGPLLVTSSLLIRSMATMRVHRYRGTRDFKKYGKDWINRVGACQVLALKMAGVAP